MIAWISRSCRGGGLVLLLLGTTAGAIPARIVSTNPCIDAILVEVADPSQIAAISHYSQAQRSTSIPLAVAARFPATSGTAEEVIAQSPDLVLADSFSAIAMAPILRRLGVPMLSLAPPETIAQSRVQVRRIAAAAGHSERGAALVARIDAALAAAATTAPPIPALIWVGGGMVPGEGTLPDALLSASGFHNQSADYGLRQWDVLPLELLVAHPPRVLLTQSTAAHLVRPFAGHRPSAVLLPSAIGGALLLVLADSLVRIAPTVSELRLDIAMSMLGGPFFLMLLLRMRRTLP